VRRRLVVGQLAVLLLVLALLSVPLGVLFGRSERRHLEARVKHDVLALALLAEARLTTGATAVDVEGIAADYTRRTGARVVIIDPAGAPIVDSAPPEGLALEDDFANPARPEFAAALAGRETILTRHSDLLDDDLLVVAAPVATGGQVHGAVRISYSMSVLQARVRRVWSLLGLFAAVILAIGTLLALRLARTVARPLQDLAGTAGRLGAGDLGARAAVPQRLPEVAVLAEVFNDTAAKLEELVGAQQGFVADASHQLRSPLAALRLRLENLEDDLDGRHAQEAAAALAEVRRLSGLIDGLLALARADALPTATRPIDVNAVVRERQATWDAYAAERGVTIEVNAFADVTATGTPGHLDQVLDNLLSNALDVAPPGTAITLSASRSGDAVEVSVADRGPGMAAEERARAFDRFWRSPGARAHHSGSGLGLPIVQRLVTADGGHVALHARDGGGLVAVVRLRAARRAPTR
jgi:signal transduction histidine kinase